MAMRQGRSRHVRVGYGHVVVVLLRRRKPAGPYPVNAAGAPTPAAACALDVSLTNVVPPSPTSIAAPIAVVYRWLFAVSG